MTIVKETKYRLNTVVAVAKSQNHIPYLAYTTIIGPKGGLILVDLYNLELIVKNSDTRNIFAQLNIERTIINYANRHGTLFCVTDFDTSDDGLKEEARRLCASALIRKSNRQVYYRVANRFDLDDIISEVIASCR